MATIVITMRRVMKTFILFCVFQLKLCVFLLSFLAGFRGIYDDVFNQGDFVAKVKQISSQSDLIPMSSFAGPSYLTIRSSVCIF